MTSSSLRPAQIDVVEGAQRLSSQPRKRHEPIMDVGEDRWSDAIGRERIGETFPAGQIPCISEVLKVRIPATT